MSASSRIASFLWWTYPRGSLEYDIMVGLILAFIFLTPRHVFRDQARVPPPPAAAQAVPAPSRAPRLRRGAAGQPFRPAVMGRLGVAVFTLAALLAPAACAAQAPAAPTLAELTAALNRTAASVHSFTADVQLSIYTKVVNETDVQTGTVAMEKTAHGPEFALDILSPAPQTMVYRNLTAWVYQPNLRQVQKFNLATHREEINEFLVLANVGLGTSGTELAENYTIQIVGDETAAGVPAVHVVLTPHDPQVAHMFPDIELWYDAQSWMAVRQKLVDPSGNYRESQYTAPQVNPSIPKSRFSTSFPGATVVSH